MSFGDHARAQQARFRFTLSPEAQRPTDNLGRRHGHLLALGHEIENLMPDLRGAAGAPEFFRDRRIKWWKSGRSGDTRTDGPTRNLASSQVACVNFLLALARVRGGLQAMLRAVDTDVEDVAVVVDRDGQSALVEIEWVGWTEPLEGRGVSRGANQTSADAVIVARTAAGNRAYVFEWKYCEAYPNPDNKGAGRSGDTRRSRYLARYHAPSSSFTGEIPLDDLLYEPFYQLMRLRLLADRMIVESVSPSLPVADARVVVVCPAGNAQYRNAVATTPLARRFPNDGTIEQLMRRTLRDPRGIAVVASEDLLAAVGAAGLDEDAIRPWLDYHGRRYGWDAGSRHNLVPWSRGPSPPS